MDTSLPCEKTREIKNFQLLKPVFIEDCQQNNNGFVKKMGKAEVLAILNISYASQMKHPNAQDCSGLRGMLKMCQRKLMIVLTQYSTLVTPSEWKIERRVQEYRDSRQVCTRGKHCEPLAKAFPAWDSTRDSLVQLIADLGCRKRRSEVADGEETGEKTR